MNPNPKAQAGYQYLMAYKLSVPIYDLTVQFVDRNFPDLPQDITHAVNLMITLINQNNYLLDRLIISLKEKHMKDGGFSENLYQKRVKYRNNYGYQN